MAEGGLSEKRTSGGSRGAGGTVFSLRCPQHPDAHLIEDYHAGDMVCPECGLVVGDRWGMTHVVSDHVMENL